MFNVDILPETISLCGRCFLLNDHYHHHIHRSTINSVEKQGKELERKYGNIFVPRQLIGNIHSSMWSKLRVTWHKA